MTPHSSIPPNLGQTLDSDSGYVFVISGKPGTGKSLFVQEIFRDVDNGFMILTNTESPIAFPDDFGESETWKTRHAFANFWRDIVGEFDYDVPIVEQLAKLIGQKPDTLDSEYIIIDSWSDFLEPLPISKQKKIEQSLIYAARTEKKKLILVTESIESDPDVSGLFHSADAIIGMEKLRQDNRMYRRLVIEKLRSMPLDQDMFLFTLHGGRFTYIPWYVHQYPAITIEREPTPDPAPDTISTGNQALDKLTGGGFRKSSVSLIEVDNLAAPYLETIYIPFLSNHISLGRPAVILLPEGWSPERFTDGLSKFVDRTRVDKQVVFFGRHALGKNPNVRSIDLDPWKTLQEISYEASQLERKFKYEATELFSLDTLENKYGPAAVKGMIAEISAALPSTRRAIVTILSGQQTIKSGSISYLIHLRVQELFGVLSVCGVNPRTNYLALRPVLSGGFLDYDLLPIV